MILKGILCRFLKHKVDPRLDFSNIETIRCFRCGLILAKKATEEKDIPASLLADKSYLHGCQGKVRFATFEQARNRIGRMKERPATLHPYQCRHCKGYHLGNSKK